MVIEIYVRLFSNELHSRVGVNGLHLVLAAVMLGHLTNHSISHLRGGYLDVFG